MSKELVIRSEDLQDQEIASLYVGMPGDEEILSALTNRSPVVLRGSRGVGKSILLRVAQSRMESRLQDERVMPVFLSFAYAPLIEATKKEYFTAWMTAKICNKVVQAATTLGLALPPGTAISLIDGGPSGRQPRLAEVEAALEAAWQHAGKRRRSFDVPGPGAVQRAVEDFCRSANINRVVLLIDEAAHVFVPEQQRQFFTLMRDLRSPYISIKAAVYPGATSYGPSFQPTHDATMKVIDRSVTDPEYFAAMREMVLRQDSTLKKAIDDNADAFESLAFAATGNPRQLLRTVSRSVPFGRKKVQEAIREYYRDQIWAEHSNLSSRYAGHRRLIDWGRRFLQSDVLPRLVEINNRSADKSSFIWIHRAAPAPVDAAMQLLCFSGLVTEGVSGTSAREIRDGVGTRYTVNFGCHLALSDDPFGYVDEVKRGLKQSRMVQFGANHEAYQAIAELVLEKLEHGNRALDARLKAPIEVLEITKFRKQKLIELGLLTIGNVLKADEVLFQKARGVGPITARQLKNSAVAAVVEYLSG